MRRSQPLLPISYSLVVILMSSFGGFPLYKDGVGAVGERRSTRELVKG